MGEDRGEVVRVMTFDMLARLITVVHNRDASSVYCYKM